MTLLLLTEDELRQIITTGEALAAVKAAFVAQAENRMSRPGRFTLELPKTGGQADITGSYLSEAAYYFVKVGSFFRDNPAQNLPAQSDLIAVFEAGTGFPAAIMIDNGYLAQVRAGAAGALAADYLANPQLERVAVLGTGNQAYIQLKSLMAVRRVGSVSVWGRSPHSVDDYARQMVEDHDLDIEIAPSPEAAVRGADLVITATASETPLVQADWLRPGAHLTAIGSNSPAKRELFPEVLQRADVIVVDSWEQCAARGELHHGLAAGAITPAQVQGELGQLILGRIPGRTRPDQITLADLTGLDVQDAAVAEVAIEKALFLGLGQRVANPL